MFQTNGLEKIKTHFTLNDFFQNLASFEIMWKNVVEPSRPERASNAIYMSDKWGKNTGTQTGRVILIAFPRQQRPPVRKSLSLYKYIALLFQFTRGCMNIRKSLSLIICSCPAERFYINHVFSTPTKCIYTMKYMCSLSFFLLHISAIIAPSSFRIFLYQLTYIKIHPEDGAKVTEIFRRMDDN